MTYSNYFKLPKLLNTYYKLLRLFKLRRALIIKVYLGVAQTT
jgi:hypothetical protein